MKLDGIQGVIFSFRCEGTRVVSKRFVLSRTECSSEKQKHSFSREQEVDPDSLNVGRWIGGPVTRTVRRY